MARLYTLGVSVVSVSKSILFSLFSLKFLNASLLFCPLDIFWKCLPSSVAISPFWSIILLSAVFMLETDLFLFLPFNALIFPHTSFADV